MQVISVHVSANRVEVPGRAASGTRRWEALTLACLIEAGGLGVTAAALQQVLQRAGQTAALDRTGLLRIFTGLQGVVDALLGSGACAKRLRFAPRHRTVGPWSFLAQAGEHWQIVGDLHGAGPPFAARGVTGRGGHPWVERCGARQALPVIVHDPDPCAIFRPLELVMRADALSTSGQLREASDLLLAASTAHKLSPEASGLVDLRRARLLKRSGRFEEALDLAREVAQRAGKRGFADPGQRGLALQLARRIRYMRAPQDHERLGADPYFGSGSFLPDVRGLGDAETLAALTARRRAMSAATTQGVREAKQLLHLSWQHLNAAIYWSVSLRGYETAEKVLFYMGQLQASLAALGEGRAVEAAFNAYQAGLLIRDNFFVGKDSVWPQICIGRLWLDHPGRRGEFETALSMDRFSLSQVDFYVDACKQARLISEPRQMALCCINLWRYAAEGRGAANALAAIQRKARDDVLDLLRGRPELMATLMADAPEAMARLLARR